jgi:hypothetical protein
VEFGLLDPLYLIINVLALVAAAWTLAGARRAGQLSSEARLH